MKRHRLKTSGRRPESQDRDTVIAAKWKLWLVSAEGTGCMSGFAGGQYLQNRLWYAFMAGARALEEYKIERL